MLKATPILVGLLAAAAYTAVVFHFGSTHGADVVQVKWDAENKRRDIATAKVEQRNKDLSTENERLAQQITKNLENSNAKYQEGLLAGRAEYAGRLQQSTTREGIYRKQAQGSTAERDRLASHAAELDRSLEEGRYLVRELRETLGLREDQLRQLGEQIKADRALLN